MRVFYEIRWQLREMAPTSAHEARRVALGIGCVLMGLVVIGLGIAVWLGVQEAATSAALNGGG